MAQTVTSGTTTEGPPASRRRRPRQRCSRSCSVLSSIDQYSPFCRATEEHPCNSKVGYMDPPEWPEGEDPSDAMTGQQGARRGRRSQSSHIGTHIGTGKAAETETAHMAAPRRHERHTGAELRVGAPGGGGGGTQGARPHRATHPHRADCPAREHFTFSHDDDHPEPAWPSHSVRPCPCPL